MENFLAIVMSVAVCCDGPFLFLVLLGYLAKQGRLRSPVVMDDMGEL